MSPIGHTDTEVGHYQTRYKLYWWPVERIFCWGWSRSYYLRKEQFGSEFFPTPVKKEGAGRWPTPVTPALGRLENSGPAWANKETLSIDK